MFIPTYPAAPEKTAPIKKPIPEDKPKTIQIRTTGTEDDCGGYYLENQSYLIYAYTTDINPYFGQKTKVKPYLTTDICIGSKLITEIEPKRLKKLKRYKKRNK